MFNFTIVVFDGTSPTFLTNTYTGLGCSQLSWRLINAYAYTRVFKFFSSVIPPLLPLIFNYFQQRMFKTALGKTVLGDGLLQSFMGVYVPHLLFLARSPFG